MGKQFMFFFLLLLSLLFLSTHARNFQNFNQQVRQQKYTYSKEHDDQENNDHPSFYKDTLSSYPHGLGATTPPPPPPLPDKPENLPSNYDANSYTSPEEHSTVNQQYQEKTVADTYGTPNTGYKPYGKQVSGQYQHYYDPNSYPNEVADTSKNTYFPENNDQHNSYKKKPVEEEEQYNTEEEEEEEDEGPATVAEKYTHTASTRNQHDNNQHDNTANQFYYQDMNTKEFNEDENNKKKDESEQPNTYKGNVFSKDGELEKYLAEEEDNVSPLEDEDTTPKKVSTQTKYNPNPNNKRYQNPNYMNPYQNPNYMNPNYNPYQTLNSKNPFGVPEGMSDTRQNDAITHYDTKADKFVNPSYFKTAFGGDNSKYVDKYYDTHGFQKNNDP